MLREYLGVSGTVVVSALALVGCSESNAIDTTAQPSVVETVVTGQVPPTSQDDQSESAFSVQTIDCTPACAPIVTVTNNDRTTETAPGTNCNGPNGACLVYTSTQRYIYAGASLLGWSVSTNGGQSYSWVGKARPPSGWKFVWGDPSITSSRRNQQYVYIANLAGPADKFPAAGYVLDDTNSGGRNTASALGGACIARSSDYGQTFTLASSDCLSIGSPKHAYDGSSMVSDLNGNIYAAFVDVGATPDNPTWAIDAWQATSETQGFVHMASQPFPGMQMHGHPRFRFDSITGRVYLLSEGAPFTYISGSPDRLATLWLTFWDGTAWNAPTAVANNVLEQPTIHRGPVGVDLRTGYQYSFDVGTPSVNNDDDIRITYTTRASNGQVYSRRYLKTVRCTRDPMALCQDSPEWSTAAGVEGDQFDPIVRAQPWFINVPAAWKISYHSTQDAPSYSASVVSTYQAGLLVNSSGSRLFGAGLLAANRPLCQSLGGYWGDYDDLQVLNVDGGTGITTFLRVLSDSRPSCQYRWQFDSFPIHLTSFAFQ